MCARNLPHAIRPGRYVDARLGGARHDPEAPRPSDGVGAVGGRPTLVSLSVYAQGDEVGPKPAHLLVFAENLRTADLLSPKRIHA
jgi:hypothetical protein